MEKGGKALAEGDRMMLTGTQYILVYDYNSKLGVRPTALKNI
jgi:hypothetical protein